MGCTWAFPASRLSFYLNLPFESSPRKRYLLGALGLRGMVGVYGLGMRLDGNFG